jgi:Fe-S-cluster containining protein
MNAPRVLADARWTCHGCGSCCRSFDIGPVEPEVIRRLEAASIGDAWAPAAGGFYEVRASPSGQPALFLTNVDGHCVFLRDDDRCAIHALLGPEAKPATCRLFPFHVAVDADGPAVVPRGTCAGWSASFVDGAPVADAAEEAVALSAGHFTRFEPARVHVLPGVDVDAATWLEIERDLLAPHADASPEAHLDAARRVLFARAERPAPPTDPNGARLAAGACFELLIRQLRAVTAAPVASDRVDPSRARVAEQMLVDLQVAQRALGRLPPLEPVAAQYASLLLRSAILGKEIHAWGGVAEGVGVWLLGVAFARGLAPADAPVPADVFGRGIVAWTKHISNRAVAAHLRLARPALVDLFLKTPPPEETA